MDRPVMTPPPGARFLKFVGDTVEFNVTGPAGSTLPEHWRAVLLTNLGRAKAIRHEILANSRGAPEPVARSWRHAEFKIENGIGRMRLALTEPGFFSAKACIIDPHGCEWWPEGPDVEISVHPSEYRTANTIYCAFPRMFGPAKSSKKTENPRLERKLELLDQRGFTVIPPSGKLRDLTRQLPHIFDTLGCRILHLLPINPTPTTYARFGRYGSPYAVQDFTAIDPALVEFDKRTTGIAQFEELAHATHALGGRLFLDFVINHTGWGSALQEDHPEWFLRTASGEFASPGAWGVTWEDLVELDHRNTEAWDCIANAFLVWCRRGVDGFRCDAGYKVPIPAWRYITSRVHEEFPNALFLLEGLGGSWEATESLLREGGMQWAYSELFQNYSGRQVAEYLDYSMRQSETVGLYVHYSETHDNLRLAAQGRKWSLLRNQLCALTSSCGGFGFTCGVEWLAAEKIDVHSNRGMAWGNPENIIPELNQLNTLLAEHPCFFDGAQLTRLSPPGSPVYALRRDSIDGAFRVLVLANPDREKPHELVLPAASFAECGSPSVDLLGRPRLGIKAGDKEVTFRLEACAVHCLAPAGASVGGNGEAYRQARARAAWVFSALGEVLSPEAAGDLDWAVLEAQVDADPARVLDLISRMDDEPGLFERLKSMGPAPSVYGTVVRWGAAAQSRLTLVPHGHWLLIDGSVPFRAVLRTEPRVWAESVRTRAGHFAWMRPAGQGEAALEIERYGEPARVEGRVLLLPPRPEGQPREPLPRATPGRPLEEPLVLLANGRGAMTRMCVDLGSIQSKYDCVLAANLHPSVPVDRHLFVKRLRLWARVHGFVTPLVRSSMTGFDPGPPARWEFAASAGDGAAVRVVLEIDLIEDENTVVARLSRTGGTLDDPVRFIARVDIEDRSFHSQTQRNPSAEHHFFSNTHDIEARKGFRFTPAPDRHLEVFSDHGVYHREPEWTEWIAHPIEASRGHEAGGEAFSPGWFEFVLRPEESRQLVLSAEHPPIRVAEDFIRARQERIEAAVRRAETSKDPFGAALASAIAAYVVRRDDCRTVIAGYPWFLDWGRDSLICARGMLAAGLLDEVVQLLKAFGRFEQNGTLPNTIHGEDASNRDTSDAPLWFGIVCEETAALMGPSLYDTRVHPGGRNLRDVLEAIGAGYLRGTPNGIRWSPALGLIWSPSHFTWMDTNFPASSPRQGYPIEIQALWARLARQLDRLNCGTPSVSWRDAADRAEHAIDSRFWSEQKGWFGDLLFDDADGHPRLDTALRPNFLFALALGLTDKAKARRSVAAAIEHLVIPGAIRSLAPLPLDLPLPIRNPYGQLLNDPHRPYRGRYEGDEDTQRKPAYHNGTGWVWLFPTFCEALARSWAFDPAAVRAAVSYLSTFDSLLAAGCLGHLPEVLDGDAPHQQRGCDAQAWSATEALRVWKILQ